MRPALVETTGTKRQPVLAKAENCMILVDGSSKPFHGRGTFQLEVEGKQTKQEAWIADIELEGILGMDCLCRNVCQIILAPGGEPPLHIPGLKSASTVGTVDTAGLGSYQCLTVTLADTVAIPANTELIAAARVLDQCDQGGLTILEPTPDFGQHSKLLIGRSLVNVDGTIPIPLLNPTPYPRRVYQNTLAPL